MNGPLLTLCQKDSQSGIFLWHEINQSDHVLKLLLRKGGTLLQCLDDFLTLFAKYLDSIWTLFG